MPLTERYTGIRRRCTCLLAAVLASQVAAANNPPNDRVDDQMRVDCRAEGEAGGLQGTELEAFVRDCINDLLTVEIGHTATD